MTDVASTPGPLDRDATVYVAGHRGLVGSAHLATARARGLHHARRAGPRASSTCATATRSSTSSRETRPRYVVLAAAKVGGILANNTYPVDFLSENLRIQINVMDAALAHGVERLLFLGSSCIYPKLAAAADPRGLRCSPGHLEPTNDAYAIAKIAGILHVQAVRRQYGLPWISAMPTNLYGPGDNFSPHGLARAAGADPPLRRGASRPASPTVTNWGTGTPRREFLHVDDMADACLHLLEHYDGPQQVNVGTGEDATIREIAEMVAEVVGYDGETEWDRNKPDGTPQKLLDVSKLAAAGWTAKIGLREGLASTVQWFRENSATLRG